MRISEHVYPPGAFQPWHAHGELTCSIILAGTLEERVGRRDVIAGALSMVVKPPGTEHSDRYGPSGVRLVRITLDQEQFSHVRPWAGELGRWQWTHGGPASRPFLSLVRAMHGPADPALHARAWECLAALAGAEGQRPGASPPAWLERVREALDDSLQPPRLAALAEAAGVHPVYLARQFRRWFGCSISGWVHRRRVRRAADLIGQGRLPLGRVSLAAGFTDQAHMCRIFGREAGVTPAAYRSLLGSCDRSRRNGVH